MQTEVRRSIRSGQEFEHLFPSPKGQHITVLKEAEVNDTLALIQKTVPLTLKDTEKIAQVLKGKTLEQTCENIWNFVYNHIQYKRDEKGIEQVRRPARSWWDRKTGVDCDCYTEFISSILTNLRIAHKLRITKYNGKSYFQHIYPIVAKDGDASKPLIYRDDYIVIDCVKDAFDDEQQFSAFKDYNGMRLDYLNGIDDGFRNHENTDVGDLSSLVDDKELNGKFKDFIKKGVRFLNRFTNPGAVMLRNGFLLAMKTNFLRLATRLRFAYLSDSQAQSMGLNMSAFQKLKRVKDKAENIYYQAGGKKENLKKAILSGKGNRDKKVPVSGLDGLDDVYADQQEYNIIHHGSINGLDGDDELGEPVTAASIASATAVLSAVAGALSQVKGLFKKNTPEAQQFDQGDNKSANESSQETSVQNSTDSDSTAISSKSRASRMASGDQQALVSAKEAEDANAKTEGVFSKASTWIKENPGKSALIATVVIGGGYMLFKSKSNVRNTSSNLNGIPHKKKRKRTLSSTSKSRITTIEI